MATSCSRGLRGNTQHTQRSAGYQGFSNKEKIVHCRLPRSNQIVHASCLLSGCAHLILLRVPTFQHHRLKWQISQECAAKTEKGLKFCLSGKCNFTVRMFRRYMACDKQVIYCIYYRNYEAEESAITCANVHFSLHCTLDMPLVS